MKNHAKIYFKAFGCYPGDFIPCELCGTAAVDIHHIDCKGMGGSKQKDFIENLQALCRGCHDFYGDKVQYKEYLYEEHFKKMEYHGLEINRKKIA